MNVSLRVRHVCWHRPSPLHSDLTWSRKVQINTLFITEYHVANHNWVTPSKFSVFDSHISLNLAQMKIYCALSATLYDENYQFEFCGHTAAYCIEIRFFYDVTSETCYFQHDGWTFCELWTIFLVKYWPVYRQFGPKYDWGCIWGVIICHFINFRQVWMLELKYQRVHGEYTVIVLTWWDE